MKTIVVSGITLRKGGTLTILRDALSHLSGMAESGKWRVVALVNKKDLCEFPNIEYIEVPLKGWIGRLWYEYVTMHKISKQLGPVYLWLSMHDVTPRVETTYQAVYFQTSFPFYRWKWRDFRFDPKIPFFAMLTRYYYRFRVGHNRYIIVQQEWLRQGLSKMLGLDEKQFVVFPPTRPTFQLNSNSNNNSHLRKVEESKNSDISQENNTVRSAFTFLYVSTADCHKNFETLCEAARLLEQRVGTNRFRVVLTLKGDENRYARWLHKRWGNVSSIVFHGLMDKETLYKNYAEADCLVFPSNIETWGLPITEYMEAHGGPMILSDLPYALNTAQGSTATAFFEPDNPRHLASLMQDVLEGILTHFSAIELHELTEPKAESWDDLFGMLSL